MTEKEGDKSGGERSPLSEETRVRTNHGGSQRVVHYDLMLTLW